MDASQFWIRFVLAALATWRLTHLLAIEEGPANLIVRRREALSRTILADLIGCFGCLSVLIAIPFAVFVSTAPVELLVTWLALSGAAFLLERMGAEPIIVERLPDAKSGDS